MHDSGSNNTIWLDGLWTNNPGLVQLLGLCPLLAVSNTAINGLALGLATTLVLGLSGLVVSLLRGWLVAEVRIPVFVLIISALVSAIDLAMQAWLYELSRTLGIFVPLIVTNCTILARAESFASRRPPWPAVQDGLAQGLGFAAVLVVLGGGREMIGQGTLLAGAEQLFGPAGAALAINVTPFDGGFLLAVLPPGAFIGLGLLVALHRRLSRPAAARTQPAVGVRTVAEPG